MAGDRGARVLVGRLGLGREWRLVVGTQSLSERAHRDAPGFALDWNHRYRRGAVNPNRRRRRSAKPHPARGGAQILASNDKAEYIGLHFDGSHVPVQRRVNSKVMWIGEGNPMLAVVEGSGTEAGSNLSRGKDVNADGLVEQAPPANEAKEAWAISNDDATKLEKQGAFIEISQLTLTQNGEGR